MAGPVEHQPGSSERRGLRKTAATELDRDGRFARQIADQLGHAMVSMTQDRYLGRRAITSAAADTLDQAYREAAENEPRSDNGA